jgi:hypothetical protein
MGQYIVKKVGNNIISTLLRLMKRYCIADTERFSRLNLCLQSAVYEVWREGEARGEI